MSLVYRLAEDLADEIWSLVHKWGWFAKATVGRQVVRSADSVGANIVEGTGRGSFVDNRRFVKIARGSLYETRLGSGEPFAEASSQRKRSTD